MKFIIRKMIMLLYEVKVEVQRPLQKENGKIILNLINKPKQKMTTQNSNTTPVVSATPVVQPTKALTIKQFFNQGFVQDKFKALLGDKSAGFITSLMQVVSSDNYLAKVDPVSIYQSAAMAAVLNLPINNNLGYAWIVPYKGKAQMQIGWKGFVQLAHRTKQYEHINVVEVYLNQFKSYNPITEVLDANFTIEGEGDVAGYAAYIKLLNGFEKTVYWSTKKVTEHARKYSKTFAGTGASPWKDKDQFHEMAKKTVLKNTLSKWGVLSIEMEKAAYTDQGVVKDVDTLDIEHIDNPENPEKVDTETGEVTLQNNPDKSTQAAAEKIDAKNNSTSAGAQPDDFTGLKVVTKMPIFDSKNREVKAGFVGTCTEDTGMMLIINDGLLTCPRSSVDVAGDDEPLTATDEVVKAPEEVHPAAAGKPIRTDYKDEELKAMATGPDIRHIAAQYINIEKFGVRVSNGFLRSIILAGQRGDLIANIIVAYPGKEVFIRDTYVEKAVTKVTPKLKDLQVIVDGEERVDKALEDALAYIDSRTGDKMNDTNILPVVDQLGEGYFDVYTTVRDLAQKGSLADIEIVINRFNGK